MRRFTLFLIVIFLLANPLPARSQDDDVTVPDVSNLPVAQAVAALNAAGLRVGSETTVFQSGAAQVSEGTVIGQSIDSATTVAYGASVDITVFRQPNALVVYDDNDLTLVNQSGVEMDLTNISFNAVEGGNARYLAARWGESLKPNQCAQVWAVLRNGPKGLEQCQFIQYFLSNTQATEHAWTQANGIAQFNVIQGTEERAICDAAPVGAEPLTCMLYLDTGLSPVTPFIYMAYTPDQIIFHNPTEDQWMRFDGVRFSTVEGVAGSELLPAEQADNPERVVGHTRRLAPGQCVQYLSAERAEVPPLEDCDVVATFTFQPGDVFWNSTLYLTIPDNEGQPTCPPGSPEQITVCIMPR